MMDWMKVVPVQMSKVLVDSRHIIRVEMRGLAGKLDVQSKETVEPGMTPRFEQLSRC